MKMNIEDTKEEALEVLSDLNEILRHTGMFEAVDDERFNHLYGKLRSLGWFGFSTSIREKGGKWYTQLELFSPDSEYARSLPGE